MQLDEEERGFSFQKDGPLDMRMDRRKRRTAEEVVNTYSEKALAEIIRDLGEEPRWKKAAGAIVAARRKKRITTTLELSHILLESLKTKTRGRLHPATLVFQGLRIYVNEELDVLKNGLRDALERLSPGGRLGVLSFQSLEDRIVKEMFKEVSRPTKMAFPFKEKGQAPFKLLTKKPLTPTEEECRANPRSRSAKLRFIEREACA